MVSNKTNHQFHRTVRLKMTAKDVSTYVPFHRGVEIEFHPHFQDGKYLKEYNGQKYVNKLKWVDATIFSSSINPDYRMARDLRDLNEELAYLDSKFGIIQENLSSSTNPHLLPNLHNTKRLIRHATILGSPFIQQNDHLRSRATEVHKVMMSISEIREIESKFAKQKAFYNKSKIEYIQQLNPLTNEKFAEVEIGYISGNEDDTQSTGMDTTGQTKDKQDNNPLTDN